MKCKSCSGPLVMRIVTEHDIDENGAFNLDMGLSKMDVSCSSCGAKHEYESVTSSTIALAVNSDPIPVATVAVSLWENEPDALEADQLVGVVFVDRNRSEVGRFLATRVAGAAWERIEKLQALIKKGEHKASYAEEEGV